VYGCGVRWHRTCSVERLFIFRMLPLDNAKFPSTVKRLFIFLFISIS
jgi:hypothetical protein